jgi:hypothetical protein
MYAFANPNFGGKAGAIPTDDQISALNWFGQISNSSLAYGGQRFLDSVTSALPVDSMTGSYDPRGIAVRDDGTAGGPSDPAAPAFCSSTATGILRGRPGFCSGVRRSLSLSPSNPIIPSGRRCFGLLRSESRARISARWWTWRPASYGPLMEGVPYDHIEGTNEVICEALR